MISLKGITWNHSRGIAPLQAISQRYEELHPGVEIKWEKRSLQHFADYPLEKLVEHYDLLIIDHPWVGQASVSKSVLPLDQYLPEAYIQDQLQNSVGLSHNSYEFGGHLWALAVDAASPAASYRKDLYDKHLLILPETWRDVLSLAKQGRVAVPAVPIDLLMSFYSFCLACGKEPFLQHDEITDKETGLAALDMMREFYSLVDKRFFKCNPIKTAELMAGGDDYFYCPFAYPYSNYSRKGYAEHLLLYTDLVTWDNGEPMRTTIGGTGLAVSAFSDHHEAAVDFAAFAASPVIQSGLYVQHGGQPGHLSAWNDVRGNFLTHDFFTNVLPVMQRGYMRPRYPGYLYFQDHAGDPLHEYLLNGGNSLATLDKMNSIYRKSILSPELTLS